MHQPFIRQWGMVKDTTNTTTYTINYNINFPTASNMVIFPNSGKINLYIILVNGLLLEYIVLMLFLIQDANMFFGLLLDINYFPITK